MINNHQNEEVLVGFETCDLYGHFAYTTLINNIEYKFKELLFTKLVKEVKDYKIKALILLEQAKYYTHKGKWKLAENNIIEIIENYSDHLFIPIPCDYDFDSKIYPLLNTKSLFFSIFYLKPNGQTESMEKLRTLMKSENKATKAIAEDLYKNMSGSFWQTKNGK